MISPFPLQCTLGKKHLAMLRWQNTQDSWRGVSILILQPPLRSLRFSRDRDRKTDSIACRNLIGDRLGCPQCRHVLACYWLASQRVSQTYLTRLWPIGLSFPKGKNYQRATAKSSKHLLTPLYDFLSKNLNFNLETRFKQLAENI